MRATQADTESKCEARDARPESRLPHYFGWGKAETLSDTIISLNANVISLNVISLKKRMLGCAHGLSNSPTGVIGRTSLLDY
jgi:hypothetical protein